MQGGGEDGGSGENAPNKDPRWARNVLSSDAVFRACGRMHTGFVAEGVAHAPGDLALCRSLASAWEAALEGVYVRRGDEGDHTWAAFCAPALEGVTAPDEPVVSQEELRLACGGALSPYVSYTATPLQEELHRMREEAEEEGQLAELQAFEGLEALAEGLGGSAATLLKPIEPRDVGIPPSVYTFFVLCRTSAGGLAGVAGNTVWT